MKNVLVESTKSKFQVLKNKPANVLKRIKGVLSDFGSNRNGRIYPRELWENVLNSDYVKEMINSHGLVGELDHPEERLEISLQEVSHVINDMWIEGDQVVGVIDILPTPNGKIVNELLDYGTDIGISSRGAGSVGAGNIVDPDYQFITFDFVARPSCEAARLNTILEGVKIDLQNNSDDKVKSILEGYKEELNESQSQEIDSAISDLKKKYPNIEEYITDYYRYIGLEEPSPAYDTDKDDINPDWEKWYREKSNFLFSPVAWENFTKFVEERYGVSLNESISMKDNSLLESAMSDQEVYKVVLNWYKEQIEKGNMTLNQCYELLSDKAKVSLNKLVDQSKIKESIMNAEISKLLTEAEEINKDQEVGLWVNGKVYWEGNKSEVTDDLLMDVADQASEEDGTTYDYDEVDIKPLEESKKLDKLSWDDKCIYLYRKYNDEFDSVNEVRDLSDYINRLYDEGGMEKVDSEFFLPAASKEYKDDFKSLISKKKLKEDEEYKPNGVIDDIKRNRVDNANVESPLELNTGVLPVLDVGTYGRFDNFWDSEELDDEATDWDAVYKDIDEDIKTYGPSIVEEYIKQVLPSAKVKATGVYHPREYNFANDELEFTVSFNPEEYKKREEMAKKDPDFKNFLKENYKSYDGFFSYLADDIDDFEDQEGWKKFVQVVMFYLKDEDFEETNTRFWDDIYGNGSFYRDLVYKEEN